VKRPLPFMISRIRAPGKHEILCAFILFPASCAGRPAIVWPESLFISDLRIAPLIGGARRTFWYIYALVALNRVDEARELFGHLLSRRNRHGLLAEHIDPRTGEPWGNFVQTYSMVGLINAAIRLSKRWDSAF